MAAYVQFYLNRGAVGGAQVMPAASIDRMETPTRAWEAQQGLKAGYGLSNYTSFHDGFEYHGHNGGVDGGLTDMSYMPEYGVGYFYSINSANGEAFGKIGDAIRAYVTRGLTRPPVPAAGQLPANAQEYAGWYLPDAPRNELYALSGEPAWAEPGPLRVGNLLLSNLSRDRSALRSREWQPVPVPCQEGSSRAGCDGHAACAQCRGTICFHRRDDAAHPHLAGDERDRADCLFPAGISIDPALCAVLDLRRADQESAASGGARHAAVAVDCGAEPGGICCALHGLPATMQLRGWEI